MANGYHKGYRVTVGEGEIFTPCPTVAWEWKGVPSAGVTDVVMDGPEHDRDDCKDCLPHMT